MDPGMIFGERRLHDRKSCAFAIDIFDYRKNHSAFLRNLSLGGAWVERPPGFKPKLEQELLLIIAFRCRPGIVSVTGKVVRTGFDGLGIAFLKKTNGGFSG